MKRLYIGPGGAPVLNDYPLAVQTALIECLSAFIGSFGQNLFLQGAAVSISGNNHTITEGWAYFNNEIMRIPAHSWIATSVGFAGGLPNTIAYTEIIETANPIPYADSSSKPLIKETVLKFRAIVSEPSPVRYFDFKSVGKTIADLLQPVIVEKTAVSGTGFAFASGVSSSGGTAISVQKRIDKTLLINGYAAGVAADASTINGIANCKLILTLAAEFRPSAPVYFNAMQALSGTYSDTPAFKSFVLFSDGKLCLRQATTPANPEVTFLTVPIPL
jgi:hypothetical protein